MIGTEAPEQPGAFALVLEQFARRSEFQKSLVVAVHCKRAMRLTRMATVKNITVMTPSRVNPRTVEFNSFSFIVQCLMTIAQNMQKAIKVKGLKTSAGGQAMQAKVTRSSGPPIKIIARIFRASNPNR